MEDSIKVVYYNKDGYHLDTVEKFCIYTETKKGNQLKDKTYSCT
jgi:hypothetical protein